MFNKLKSLISKITPKNQDQTMGLVILTLFCLLTYIVGYAHGFEKGQVKLNFEDPTSITSDNHIRKLLETFECPKAR